MRVNARCLGRVAVCIAGALVASMAMQGQATNILPTNGKVGIGTTTPSSLLDVWGGNVLAEGPGGDPSFVTYKGDAGVSSLYFGIANTGQTPAGNRLAFYTNSSAGWSGSSEKMVIMNSGNVGIGTSSPSASLDINSNLGGYASRGGTATTFQASLRVHDSSIGVLRIENDQPVGNDNHLLFVNTTSPGNSWDIFHWGSSLAFRFNYGSPVNVMTMLSGGNVGIGTTTPAYKFDVAGQVRAQGGVVFPDGSTQSVAWTGSLCGGDYAESIDVSGDRTKYEPGDVLVIDAENPGKFLKSAESYSTAVTGVYSTKPGVVGRRQSSVKNPDEVPMAMIGIVPTKVSAENGPIKPGDLLVTSSTMGYAMKGTDRTRIPGAVIGKALGNLDSGTGIVEVVVTLQ